MLNRKATFDGDMELRHGDWRTTLPDIEPDVLLVDPPYGQRTHSGQSITRADAGALTKLSYPPWTARDVIEFVSHWAPRTRGWFGALTSHDLIPTWEVALAATGRTCFAPVPCVQRGMAVRIQGDGPSNWTCYLMLARPRRLSRWGTRRGAYIGGANDVGSVRVPRGQRPCTGGKPDWLMRDIVDDYSLAGDLVVDPCAGGGATLLAARELGRRSIGAERSLSIYRATVRRLQHHTRADPLVTPYPRSDD